MKTFFSHFTLIIVLCSCISSIQKTYGQDSEKRNGIEYEASVEEMPEIIGGIDSLAAHIIYPASARKDKIEGSVYVKVYISENGSVNAAEVVSGIPELNDAALAAFKSVKFTSPRNYGKPAKVFIIVPIKFQLD